MKRLHKRPLRLRYKQLPLPFPEPGGGKQIVMFEEKADPGNKVYRVQLRGKNPQWWEGAAASAEDACQKAGWKIEDCWVRVRTDSYRDPNSKSGSGWSGGGWKNITTMEIK